MDVAAFEDVFITSTANNEVFEMVLAETMEDDFQMMDFLPRYSYLILEMNMEYKKLLEELNQATF